MLVGLGDDVGGVVGVTFITTFTTVTKCKICTGRGSRMLSSLALTGIRTLTNDNRAAVRYYLTL